MAESTVTMAAGNRGRPISRNTVQNWLRECGIICHRPSHGTTLTQCLVSSGLETTVDVTGVKWLHKVIQESTSLSMLRGQLCYSA